RAKEREPENPDLQTLGIIVYPNRVVLPRPKLAREQTYPEPKLDTIDKTKEDLTKAMQDQAAPLPAAKTRFEDVDLYDENPPTAGGAGQDAPAPVAPGSGNSPGKGRIIGRPSFPASREGGGLPEQQKSLAIPEKCLVRFVDYTVQVGRTYEYK